VVILSFLSIGIEVNIWYAIILLLLFGSFGLILNIKIKDSNYLKPAYLGIVFIIAIIMSSNHIFKDNELKINSVKPIALFIQENSPEKPKVLVYNYLLPSLSFYLDQDITTINHGRYTTQREIQFETNDKWRDNLINYFDENDRLRLLNLNEENSTYLIKRKKDVFPDTLQVIANRLKNKKEFEKFEVYY